MESLRDCRNACTNGPDEYGEWPCDPVDNGDGTATCSECGWTGGFAKDRDSRRKAPLSSHDSPAVATERIQGASSSLRGCLRRLPWFRHRWFVQRDEDTRPYFEATFVFQARDMTEAERLWDAMEDGLGCGDGVCDENTPCPHFRFGALHQMDEDE